VLQATDLCGNSANAAESDCLDTTAPVIIAATQQRRIWHRWTLIVPTATDNSGTNTITIVSTVTNTAGHCGATF